MLRVVLRRIQPVEGSGASDQILVLARQAGRLARRQSFAKGSAVVGIGLLGHLKPERRRFAGAVRLPCDPSLLDGGPQRSRLLPVYEIGISEVLLDLWQVIEAFATQADEEAGEDQAHEREP